MGTFFLIAFFITLVCILLLIFPLLKSPAVKTGGETSIFDGTATTKKVSRKGRFFASLAITVFITIGGWLVYFTAGNPTIIQALEQSKNQMPAEIERMIAQLEGHLEQDKTDLEGWLVKAMVDSGKGEYEAALESLQTAYTLSQQDPYVESLSNIEKGKIISRLVDTAVVVNGGQFTNEVHQLLIDAKNLDDNNPQTMWLLAMSYSQKGEHNAALEYFTHTKALLEATGQAQAEVAELDRLIAQEMQIMGQQSETLTGNNENPADDLQTDGIKNNILQSLSGGVPLNIQLSEQTISESNPEQTVFIIARAINGPPAPLAVVKKSVADFPLDITIDNSMGMLADTDLSKYLLEDNLKIVVRLSKSGQPIKQDGDIESEMPVHQWLKDGNSFPLKLTL